MPAASVNLALAFPAGQVAFRHFASVNMMGFHWENWAGT
jgi:hypothetical protein